MSRWGRQTGGWHVAQVMSLLGASLAGQDKFTEAEPLLLDAYNQMQDHAETIPDEFRDEQLRDALQRIINLYEAWDAAEPGMGHADKVAEWRAALTAPQPVHAPESPAPPLGD